MPSIVVLGAGRIGALIAADLAAEPGFSVTVADASAAALARAEQRAQRSGAAVRLVEADCGNPEQVAGLASSFDLVVGALPSRLGYAALEAIIDVGRPCCDISFMSEDFLALDARARERGVVVIADCGVAPGMSNLLAARGVAEIAEPERVEILVGGVPRERRLPFQYQAGFAPRDVVAEYLRPARQVESGRVVIHEALSGIEHHDFEGIGTLEAFHTDGLRSLATTLKVPTMVEKTMRWPGHAELMRAFRHAGFFGDDPVRAGDVSVRPIELTAQLLFPHWQIGEGDVDLTVMRVRVAGRDAAGAPREVAWDLVDERDLGTGDTSMARTTAFPAAIVARMIADGTVHEPGVSAPERIGTDAAATQRILDELAARGVVYRRRG